MLFNGKRVYKNAFLYQANFHDTKSALLSHKMREKVSVFLSLLWRMVQVSGYCIILCCCSVTRSVGIAFSPSCFTKLNLAVTKNQRTTILFGEDY